MATFGPSTCHPDRPAHTADLLCRACYNTYRRNARQQKAAFRLREMEQAAKGMGLELVRGAKPKKRERFSDPPVVDVADAVKRTDAELIAALPEAAIALRAQLTGKAQLKAAEILLRSFVVPTPDGPRRFLSDPRTVDSKPAGTQVVIGLHVDSGAAQGFTVGQVVGTLEPSKQPSKS